MICRFDPVPVLDASAPRLAAIETQNGPGGGGGHWCFGLSDAAFLAAYARGGNRRSRSLTRVGRKRLSGELIRSRVAPPGVVMNQESRDKVPGKKRAGPGRGRQVPAGEAGPGRGKQGPGGAAPPACQLHHHSPATIARPDRGVASNRCADLVDDVVVVDSGSRDDTVAVAEAHGARVIFNAWPGYGPQKRFAEDAARHAWILFLDADEWLPREAREEIAALFAQGEPALAGFPVSHSYRLYRAASRKPRPYRLAIMRMCGCMTGARVRIPASLVHDAITSILRRCAWRTSDPP